MNFTYLISISDGDESFIGEFISTFERNSAKILNDLRQAIAENDVDRQRKLAHQLKPSLEMLKMEGLEIALAILDSDQGASTAQLEALEKECADAIQQLRTHFNC